MFVSLLILSCLLALGAEGQDSLRQQKIVISQNANGQIRLVDGSNNSSRVINISGNSEENQVSQEGEEEEELDEQVVRGLWEWLEEKKRKKKEKKEEKKRPKPLIKPTKIEKKEIHIHINNHIKKKDDHKKKKDHHEHHYESYHDGGFDYHDKHYQSKHSWPLLGHHYYGSDHDYYGGGHGAHGGGHDDYGGYESRKVVARQQPGGRKLSASSPRASKSKSAGGNGQRRA